LLTKFTKELNDVDDTEILVIELSSDVFVPPIVAKRECEPFVVVEEPNLPIKRMLKRNIKIEK